MSSKINDFFTAAIVGEAFVLELKRDNRTQALPTRRPGAFSFPTGDLLGVATPLPRTPPNQFQSKERLAPTQLDSDWLGSGAKHSSIRQKPTPKNHSSNKSSSTWMEQLLVLLIVLALALGGAYLLWT